MDLGDLGRCGDDLPVLVTAAGDHHLRAVGPVVDVLLRLGAASLAFGHAPPSRSAMPAAPMISARKPRQVPGTSFQDGTQRRTPYLSAARVVDEALPGAADSPAARPRPPAGAAAAAGGPPSAPALRRPVRASARPPCRRRPAPDAAAARAGAVPLRASGAGRVRPAAAAVLRGGRCRTMAAAALRAGLRAAAACDGARSWNNYSSGRRCAPESGS